MANRYRKIKPDSDGYLRTGIYQRRVVPETISPEEYERRCEEAERSLDALCNPPSIHGWLNGWMEYLANIIRPHLDDGGHTRYSLDLGDGWQDYRLTDEFADTVTESTVRDAIECMGEIYIIKDHVGEDNSLTGGMHWVVGTAFKLGRISERMKIRSFEPHAKRGREILDSATAGGKLNAKLSAEQRQQVAAKVADLMAAGQSQNDATKQVAALFKISKSTAARYYQADQSK